MTIDIESLPNRLLKVCNVPATSAHLPRLLFICFLLWPLTVLMKQTRQVVCAEDHLHWRCLLSKLSATVTLDCTCLGYLGWRDIYRIISIYVVLPKVAKASKYWLLLLPVLSHNLHQCEHALATLGDATQIVFMSPCPRCPRLVSIDCCCCRCYHITFTNVNMP